MVFFRWFNTICEICCKSEPTTKRTKAGVLMRSESESDRITGPTGPDWVGLGLVFGHHYHRVCEWRNEWGNEWTIVIRTLERECLKRGAYSVCELFHDPDKLFWSFSKSLGAAGKTASSCKENKTLAGWNWSMKTKTSHSVHFLWQNMQSRNKLGLTQLQFWVF